MWHELALVSMIALPVIAFGLITIIEIGFATANLIDWIRS